MIQVDQWAYRSRLRQIHPVPKIFFTALGIALAIGTDNGVIQAFLVLTSLVLCCWVGHTPFVIWGTQIRVPFLFLLTAILPVLISFHTQNASLVYSFSLGGARLGSTVQEIQAAGWLFGRAFGALSCSVFLALSTPMTDLYYGLRCLKLPQSLLELMMLVYRLIFVVLEEASTMRTAQEARLGYGTFWRGFSSLSSMLASLFIRTMQKTQQYATALDARGYQGVLYISGRRFKPSAGYFWGVLGYGLAMLFLDRALKGIL